MDQSVAARRGCALRRGREPADDGVPGGDFAVEGEEVGVVGDVDRDLRGLFWESGAGGKKGGEKGKKEKKRREVGGRSHREKHHREVLRFVLISTLLLLLSLQLVPAPPSPSAAP